MRPHFAFVLFLLAPLLQAAPPEFSTLFRLLDERCVECHAKDDYEGGLVLEDHASLMKGGESGASVIPGKSAESLLIKYLRGEVEKDGSGASCRRANAKS